MVQFPVRLRGLLEPGGKSSPWLFLGLLAVLYTWLNAVKPLHIDDTAYYYYARQMAEHPRDPYGFKVFWVQAEEPANKVLAPPLLPYWWSLALRLFGRQPFLWKLWLFPFSLLFVGSLYALLRRFARGLEGPLLWMMVLSPVFLPSLNLMLDVPAFALGAAALALFFRACDRSSAPLAVLAGLCAGLAFETKYNAVLVPVVMLLYALLVVQATRLHALRAGAPPAPRGTTARRRWLLWLAAVVVAVWLVVRWEQFIYRTYGVSHFLFHARKPRPTFLEYLGDLSVPLLGLLGGVAATLALLAASALRWRWYLVAGGGAVVVLGYAVVALSPPEVGMRLWLETVFIDVAQAIFVVLGALVCLALGAVAWRLLRVSRGGLWRVTLWRRHAVDWFLVLWLGLEVGGYFVLSPFAAARRVMGLVIVGTLLAGRLASLTCRRPARKALVYAVAAGTVILGLGFYAIDLREAQAQKEAALEVAAWIRRQDRDHDIWFTGHYGFRYYAEEAGMKPVVPNRSQLRQGDWLVMPARDLDKIDRQVIGFRVENVEFIPKADLPADISDSVPLRSVPGFYTTTTGSPLERQVGPRVALEVARVRSDFVPDGPARREDWQHGPPRGGPPGERRR